MAQPEEFSALKEKVREALSAKGLSIDERELEQLTEEYRGVLRVLMPFRQLNLAEREPATSFWVDPEAASG